MCHSRWVLAFCSPRVGPPTSPRLTSNTINHRHRVPSGGKDFFSIRLKTNACMYVFRICKGRCQGVRPTNRAYSSPPPHTGGEGDVRQHSLVRTIVLGNFYGSGFSLVSRPSLGYRGTKTSQLLFSLPPVANKRRSDSPITQKIVPQTRRHTPPRIQHASRTTLVMVSDTKYHEAIRYHPTTERKLRRHGNSRSNT